MIAALIKLTRPHYSLPLSLGLVVIVAYVCAGRLASLAMELSLGTAALYFVISGAYVLNDICDVETDRINRPRRVLIGLQISRQVALRWTFVLFAVGLALAVGCNPAFFGLLAAVVAGLIAYDVFSKQLGILKDILAAVLTVSLYPLAFALTEPVESVRLQSLYIFPVWLFITAVAFEMLKDVIDSVGDGPGMSRHSSRRWFELMARTCIFLAGWVALLPGLLGYCGQLYLAAATIALLLTSAASFIPPQPAVRLIYVHVVLITAASLLDLLVL